MAISRRLTGLIGLGVLAILALAGAGRADDLPAADAKAAAFLTRLHSPDIFPSNQNIQGVFEWRNAATPVMKLAQGQWVAREAGTRPPAKSWPEFQLQVTTDQKNNYGFPNPYNAKLPLAPGGTIFIGDGPPAKVEITERSWTGMTARYRGKDGTMDLTVSRLTPAALISTEGAGQINLFGDLLFDIIPKGNKDVQPKPRFIAIPTAGGVKVFQGPGEFEIGKEMTEGWALVWFGKDSYISTTLLPTQQQYHWSNATWPKRVLGHYDCPWLLVFGKKPTKVKLSEPVAVDVPENEPLDDTCNKATFRYWEKHLANPESETGKLKGLTVSFEGGAGQIALMPLYGTRYVLMGETEKWGQALPAPVAADCRKWSGVLRQFPVSADETYKLADSLDELTVTTRVSYQAMGNPFNEKAAKVAPLPGVLALAAKTGIVRLSAPVIDLDCPSSSGPVCGIADVDEYQYTVSGLDRYLWQHQTPAAAGEAAKPVLDKMQAHAKQMFEAGLLQPTKFSPTREVPNPWWRFGNTGELVATLEMLRPFLSAEYQAQIELYVAQQAKAAPFGSGQAPFWTGTSRDAYDWPDAIKQSMQDYPAAWWPQDFYALGTWYGRYGSLADKAAMAAAMEKALTGLEDWNLGPLDLPQPPQPYQWNTGYVGQLNGDLQRSIGCARLAYRLGRRDLVDLAAYRFARMAAQRIGCEELVKYLYDAKLFVIPSDMDWSAVLVKNNGNGAFIPDHWRGADDDVRQVTVFDPSGAELGAFLIWRGHATQFSPYQDLTPETGRLLHDYALKRCQQAFARMQQRLPSWWLTRGPKFDMIHGEALYSPPDNSWQLLLMAGWTLGLDGPQLARYVDVPNSTGDFYYLQKLAVAAGAHGKAAWSDIRKEQK